MTTEQIGRRLADNPIAIVGLASLFPRSPDLESYWRSIVSAADCITDVPATHWRVEDFYDPDPQAPDKTYCKRGGFIPDTPFNPVEFGMPPNILEVTDVLQLLSLVVARELERDLEASFDRSRTGVVLGVTGANQLTQPLSARLQTPVLKQVVRSCGLSEADAEMIAEKYRKAYIPWEENSFPGMLGNVVAGRIANRFDLGGTNCTVDAACASSLAAPKMAISELLEGRADMMITGGCDAENTILMFMCFSKTPAFSKSGVIRPFDADADGTLIGEGIGLLALKRLADAERDGDRIYAVIRGLGSSSDGRYKSIYAPRPEGQVTALCRAYDDADCSPASVELFEAHATGTEVGDRCELSSLATVVAEATGERNYAAVGSVKSQIGHTKGAAGAASLIKVALALHHRVLPPTINVERPNEAIEDSPFYVNTLTRPWIRTVRRPQRRAAVSAFGFGGTNFHLVLQEHEPARRTLHGARCHLWHAATTDELAGLVREQPLPSVTEPIPEHHARVGFVATGAEQADALRELAVEQLRERADDEQWSHPKGVHYRRGAVPAPQRRVGALFAGQGSQYVNLGRAAVAALPPLLAAFDAANETFGEGAEPLSAVAFPPPAFDDESRAAQSDRLRRTEYAQPAIGALSAGQYRYLTQLGLVAEGFAGHSFGELTALWAAGSLDDADYFRLARSRGQAMAPPAGRTDGYDPGTMAVVDASTDEVRAVLGELAGHAGGEQDLRLCNLNAPRQQVVGGGTEAIERLLAHCAEHDVRAQRLPVAAAFHTEHVGHAVEAFGEDVAAVSLRAPAGGSVYADTPGAEYGDDTDANRRVLAEQLVNPVDFAGLIERMYADGLRVFVEFGPKGLLSRLVSDTLEAAGHADAVVLALDGGPDQDADVAVKQGAVRLAVLGVPLTDLNRYLREPLPAPETKGIHVMLNGINHVPDPRRDEYREALEDGQRVSGDGARPAAAEPTEQPAAQTTARPAGTAQPASAEQVLQVAEQNLGLHSEYLAGQIDTASRLVSLLEQHTDGDGPAETLTRGVEAVKDHGLAVGHAHERANEVLRDLVAMELGVADGVTPHRADSARVGAPTPPRPEPTTSSALACDEVPAIAAPPPAEPAVAHDPTGDASGPPVPDEPVASAEPEPAEEPVAAAAPADNNAAATGGAGDQERAQGDGSTGIDVDTARSTLVELVAEKTGYPEDMLEPDMDVEADLGIDSIKRLQIMGALRDRFPGLPEVGPESMAELRTLEDIAGLLAGASTGAGQSSDAEGKARDGSEQPDARIRIERGQATLTRLPPVERLVDPFASQPVALIVDDGDATCPALRSALEGAGWTAHSLALPGQDTDAGAVLGSWDEDELGQRLAQLVGEGGRVDLVMVGAGRPAVDWDDALRRCEHALLVAKHTQAALRRAAKRGRAAFVTLTRLDGAMGHEGAAPVPTAVLGGLGGLVKTLAIEAPELFCRAVDVDPELDADTAARLVVDEAHDAAADVTEVGVDGTGRRTVTLSGSGAGSGTDVPAPGPDDLLVVTGGGRGVTAACAVGLAERYRCGLLLLGRTELTEEPPWAAGLDGTALKSTITERLRAGGGKVTPRDVERAYREIAGTREVRGTVEAATAAGSHAEYRSVDIADGAAVRRLLGEYTDRITGVVHGAGAVADRHIADKRPEDAPSVFAPKVVGLRNVLAAVPPGRLRHLVLFSSVAGFFGNEGQADYAIANEALNRIARAIHRDGEHGALRATALNWGAWAGGMVNPELADLFAERGVQLVPVEDGVRLLVEQFEPQRADDVVTVLAPAGPLSARAAAPLPEDGARTERSLAALTGEPVLDDHRIGGHPVLPATVALGWCVNAAERLLGGRTAAECRDFQVLGGVVFDGDEPDSLRLHARPAGDDDTLEVTLEDGDRSRYRATVVLVGAGPAPTIDDLPGDGSAQDAAGLYEDGTLFHGPALRGIRRVLADEPSRVVFECRLPDHEFAGGGYAGHAYSPVLADPMLQASLVVVRRRHGAASLPVGIERVQLYEPLPDDEPFLVVVEDIEPTDGTATVTSTVSACAPDGRVLARFAGVTVVPGADLAEKFSTN